MAALAAMALMVGAFALPATVPVAYADSTHTKTSVHDNTHINAKDSCVAVGGGAANTCSIS
jgi:hypothetical protein